MDKSPAGESSFLPVAKPEATAGLTWHPLLLAAMVSAITVAHYATRTTHAPFHDIYRRLYYIPIILASFWYGVRGGCITALVISILYAFHVVLDWGGLLAPENLEKILEILLYNVIAVITGTLSQRQVKERMRYERAANELERSHSELKHKTQALFDTEEQLRRADRLSALGELSAGVAHEIRNPLSSIKGSAEILSQHFKSGDPQYEFVQIMIKEVNRLNTVVSQFLDFARPKAPAASSCQIEEVLKSVLSLTHQEMVRTGVEVQLDVEDNLPQIVVDEEQMRQVFLNLIMNAIRAMTDGGKLHVSATHSDNKITCSFSDTGVGIASENIPKIFNPFFTTTEQGTGLGLSIVHRIVDSHGGSIKVESKPDYGARFDVVLPLDRKDTSV